MTDELKGITPMRVAQFNMQMKEKCQGISVMHQGKVTIPQPLREYFGVGDGTAFYFNLGKSQDGRLVIVANPLDPITAVEILNGKPEQ